MSYQHRTRRLRAVFGPVEILLGEQVDHGFLFLAAPVSLPSVFLDDAFDAAARPVM